MPHLVVSFVNLRRPIEICACYKRGDTGKSLILSKLPNPFPKMQTTPTLDDIRVYSKFFFFSATDAIFTISKNFAKRVHLLCIKIYIFVYIYQHSLNEFRVFYFYVCRLMRREFVSSSNCLIRTIIHKRSHAYGYGNYCNTIPVLEAQIRVRVRLFHYFFFHLLYTYISRYPHFHIKKKGYYFL